jgi:hypothetical protein
MNVSPCPAAGFFECTPAQCPWSCGLDSVDTLLCQPGASTGEETDLLLELRSHLWRRTGAEEALRLFCDLRRRMEARHYLTFFRLRRWFENHLVAMVSSCPASTPQEVPVRLEHYCVEAVRRACLCAGLGKGVVLLAPRVRFAFRPPPERDESREWARSTSQPEIRPG